MILDILIPLKKLLFPGVQKPVYLINFVTNSCNASCEHCFYWKELNSNKETELTVKEHRKIAKSLGRMLQITFTGGSPELRKDLPEIVYQYYKYCKPANMTFCMLGYNTKRIIEHTQNILKTCNNQQITIGLSLDGLHSEHDKYRKLDGLFDRVLQTINELNKLKTEYNNLRVDIGMVIHGLNINNVKNSAIWVHENINIDKLKPILVRGNPLNPSTLDEKCIGVYNEIIDKDKEWLISKNKNQLSIIDRIIIAKENVQRGVIKKIVQTNKSEIKCSGARETAVLYPNGNVNGCEMRNDILGNLRDYNFNFKKIWFSKDAKRFRNTVGKVDECYGCYHHCFISPAIFRTPKMWIKLLFSFLNTK
jgi:radical SAM protein with 4Fe4S-binding SPASM domain